MIAGFPGSVAANEYVECVQNQLRRQGFDPGVVDGQMGPKTRAAFGAFAEDAGIEAPRLTNKSSLTWCREITGYFPPGKPYWPSYQPSIFKIDDAIRVDAKWLLRRSFASAKSYFKRNYDVELVSRIDIAGSGDTAQLGRYAVQLLQGRGDLTRGAKRHIRKVCDKPETIAAIAFRNQIIVCWPEITSTHREEAAQQREKTRQILKHYLPSLMVHEFMHHIQYELSETKSAPYKREGQRQIPGPTWLAEGSASYMEFKFNAEGERFDIFTSAKLRGRARKGSASLRQLRALGSVDSHEDYAIAHFASYLLARRYGSESLVQYWRELGKGKSWEQAFSDTFHMKLKDYEAMVSEFIKDYGAAVDFMLATE